MEVGVKLFPNSDYCWPGDWMPMVTDTQCFGRQPIPSFDIMIDRLGFVSLHSWP